MARATIADLLTRSAFLNGADREAAVAWVAPLEDDVVRAVRECPRARWLLALARELGEDRPADRFRDAIGWSELRLKGLEALARIPWREYRRRVADRAGNEAASDAELEAGIEALRAALDAPRMAEHLRSLPEDETPDERDERIITRALDDARALAAEDLSSLDYAGRWGLIGGRTFPRISPAAAAHYIERSRCIALPPADSAPEQRSPISDAHRQAADDLRARLDGGETPSAAIRAILGAPLEDVIVMQVSSVRYAIESCFDLPDDTEALVFAWLQGDATDEDLDRALRP